jgi:type III pantothenate kinase
LSEHTAKLPLVTPAMPLSAVGRNSIEAIQSGVCYGVVGAIRGIVEQIATEQNRWPQVVLTGGGSAALKDRLDFVDSWAPNLCLMGIGLAYMRRAGR